MDKLCIGWTTLGNKTDALAFANGLVDKKLSFCVQIDGGCTSVYPWKGNIEESEEVRVWVKFFEKNQELVEEYIDGRHPYKTPQWLVVKDVEAGENYLEWARDES